VCGDGILNQACGEECDDGNNLPGDGCDPNCRLEGGVLDINGEYAIDVDTTLDTCGFGSGSSSNVMEVVEQTQSSVTVNIPVGGPGGECNRQDFDRMGNTVTRTESSNQTSGDCTILVEVTTSFSFYADNTLTGFEINSLSAAGGDCSGFTLPCEVRLATSGARCSGCFDCFTPLRGSGAARLGLLGSAAGAEIDAPRPPAR
jgi:cysteine-rich repeat protein